ncbi:hypothetical protein [Membranihabitans maritimus]|uniref:hypothetical protein n=1 Tax=Membranihabitans maritimus TaxID=2904244 RepID=UPI001F23D888|nr:hypothetical protein [Membranihabitans maritimus]
MNRILLGLSFILLFTFLGCNSDNETNSGARSDNASTSSNQGGSIQKPPARITGLETHKDAASIGNCGGLFATSEEELNNENYLLTSNLESFGLIMSDGKIIKLKQVGQQFMSGTARFYKYESDGITVDIEIREVRDLNEKVELYKGQLKVNSGDYIDVIQIVGKVGCS